MSENETTTDTDEPEDELVEEDPVRAAALAPSLRTFETAAIAEFAIRSGGDGRTVDAYAVPFDEPAEILDAEGHYFEAFAPGAFGRMLKRGFANVTVLYNHGRDILMRPSERFSVPIGKPIEMREDGRGLFTATRFASTELGDEILQLIDEGILTHQSVQFIRTPGGRGTRRIRGGHKASGLDLVTRHDVNVIEYGPTPIPVYSGAEVVGVRATQLAAQIHELPPEERLELSELLRSGISPSSVDGDDPEHEPEATPDVASRLLADRHELMRRQHERK
jgi:HK97 family phage prohead protease